MDRHKKRNWIRALRRSKSFRYFVISYVALLCAIMALHMVYYRKSSSMLFEQSVAMNNTQAEQFASTLETEISNCMDSLLKIEKTYAFSQLLNDDSAGNALDRWDIYELRAQMKDVYKRQIKEDTFIIPQFYRESRVKKENGRTISKMPPKDAAAWISGKKQIGSRRIGLRGGSGLGL